MLDQRDVTGKAALHHAVADTEERHTIVSTLLAAKAKVKGFIIPFIRVQHTFKEGVDLSVQYECVHMCVGLAAYLRHSGEGQT